MRRRRSRHVWRALPLANERGGEVGDGQAEPTTALGLRNVEDLTDEVAAIDAQR
jgi:hypothetical protein